MSSLQEGSCFLQSVIGIPHGFAYPWGMMTARYAVETRTFFTVCFSMVVDECCGLEQEIDAEEEKKEKKKKKYVLLRLFCLCFC